MTSPLLLTVVLAMLVAAGIGFVTEVAPRRRRVTPAPTAAPWCSCGSGAAVPVEVHDTMDGSAETVGWLCPDCREPSTRHVAALSLSATGTSSLPLSATGTRAIWQREVHDGHLSVLAGREPQDEYIAALPLTGAGSLSGEGFHR